MEHETEDLRIIEREPSKEELLLGYVERRDEQGKFYSMMSVPQADRITHFYTIGASGTGKSTLLEHLIKQDIQNGFGFGIIDPHGDLVNHAMEMLAVLKPENLEERVVLIDPTDEENTVCFNPLELAEGQKVERLAKELVKIFERIWKESWGERMEDIFTSTLIVLIENHLTFDEVPQFLTDAAFRSKLVARTKNEKIRQFFQDEFDELNARTRGERITSTTDKVRQFLSDEAVRDIFLSPRSSFNFREIMDNQKILLVRIPKGILGEENSKLLGSLILAKIEMAASSRANIAEEERVPFYCYIDEFQNFAGENFITVLDESRKYKLAFTLAHQNLGQVHPRLKSSLLNCPLQAYFRVLRSDAEVLAKEMFVGISATAQPWETYFQAIQNLQDRTCFIKSKDEKVSKIIVPAPFAFEAFFTEWLGDKAPETIKHYRNIEKAIGRSYLRKREDIREEHRAVMRNLLAGGKEPEREEDLFEKSDLTS